MTHSKSVVMACDRNYIAPAAVTIKSILDHTKSPVHFYVLAHKATEEYRSLNKVGDVEIVEVGEECENVNTFSKARITSPAYYRLLIPELLKSDRCLYTDVDVVFNEDIDEIYDCDLEGAPIGAVRDIQGYSLYLSNPLIKDYWEKVVETKPECYFCSGFLLFDLRATRQANYPFLETARAYPWTFHDMDVLNHVIKDNVKILDPRWVVMPPEKFLIDALPDKEKREVENAIQSPAVYHYAGDKKPWTDPLMWKADKWWEVAERLPSPLYQEAIALTARSAVASNMARYNSQIASLQVAVERLM